MRKNEIVMSFGFCVIGGLEFEWMPKMQARTAPKGQTSTESSLLSQTFDLSKNKIFGPKVFDLTGCLT